MRKKAKQILRKSLCGILCAAMLFSGISVPEFSAKAAEIEITEETAGTEETENKEESTSREESEKAQESALAEEKETEEKKENASSEEMKESEDKAEESTSREDEKTEETKQSTVEENTTKEKESVDDEGTSLNKEIKEESEIEDEKEDLTEETISSDISENTEVNTVTLDFYFYARDISQDDVVGLYKWTKSGSNITSTATAETWSITWKDGSSGTAEIYPMTIVENHLGWYKINLTITDEITNANDSKSCNAGFKLYKKSDMNENNALFVCDVWDNEIYEKLLTSNSASYAVKNGQGYSDDMVTAIMRNITLYAYSENGIPVITADNELSYIDEETGAESTLVPDHEVSGDGWANYYYHMKPDSDANWYYLQFSAPLPGVKNKICDYYIKGDSGYTWTTKFCDGAGEDATDFAPVFQGNVYYKDGIFYDSKSTGADETIEQVKADLDKLVKEANGYKQEDYKETGWEDFTKARDAASAALEKEGATIEELKEALNNLKSAMDALIDNVSDDLNVKKISLTDDFITGADLSSYISLKYSGVVFKDEDGNELSDAEFFTYLYEGGTNWVRIRVWNDPYDSDGNGYGGGNNDLEKAKKLGKLATDAGMKVLIDFHYSDFWADPGKQQTPKAWSSYTIDEKADAVKKYTLDSLNTLKEAGVNVGMVQVGNETNGQICGETSWSNMAKIFNAGSEAIREFDENCLVAVHFTNPEKGYTSTAKALYDNKVDYDVFASSYYPYWHGTTDNLTTQLTNIAKQYGKKVMVAETSWATTLEDQDGHDNTVREGVNDNDQPYDFSVQGQADEIMAVINAANNVNNTISGSCIGVFYWEPAWISKYNVYDENGNKDQNKLDENKKLWEEHGSGWASSYASEYDPDDAGKWFGGSAIDNQAWFDFSGKALPTAKIYSYIRKHIDADKAIVKIEKQTVSIDANGEINYPDSLTVYFNDGTEEKCSVTWDENHKKEVNTTVKGTYRVGGSLKCTYTLKDGTTTNIVSCSVIMTIIVKDSVGENLLVNPGFEDGNSEKLDITSAPTGWTIEGSGIDGENTRDARTGEYGIHFNSENDTFSFSVKQTVKTLEIGTYVFGGYIQGGGTGSEDLQYAVVEVYDSEGKLKNSYKKECTLSGWNNWQKPEITDIVLAEGDYLIVGMEVASTVNGAWGTIDDLYLYKLNDITLEDLEDLVVKAEKYIKEDYKDEGWTDFTAALDDAKKVIAKENPSNDEIGSAYNALKSAMDALILNLPEAEINVAKVALADDFITGADLSSYASLKDSGVVFKDKDGKELSDAEFFKYLYDGGTNWVRIRVWNNPYNSDGNGYGGGNNDLEKAKVIGKLATDAGMKVLIDFHYSDFWADPPKQQAPKAWASYTVDQKVTAVKEYTLNSLNALKEAGVNVCMVQAGNETNNGVCGENTWTNMAKIFNAGYEAVKEFDENCLVAVHFTDAQKGYETIAKNLADNNVQYDVFASSYYPYWHGTTENLTSVLTHVAQTYNKKVMVAETSWATTLEDQDGHGNTVSEGNNDSGQKYDFSVQGQADEIRDVVNAANNVNENVPNSSIGVFYWEPAWISKNYVYDEYGNIDQSKLAENKKLWEKYGSGWASSYSAEYDPDDAGKWFGGSAIDNQAWFDFDGKALPTAQIYSLIRSGAVAERAITSVENPHDEIPAENQVSYPKEVNVRFNDGTEEKHKVTWNEEDKAKVDITEAGTYKVRGSVTCTYKLKDGVNEKTEIRNVIFTLVITEPVGENLLKNPGFEEGNSNKLEEGKLPDSWSGVGTGLHGENATDVHSGSYGLHFYSADLVDFTVTQKVENLEPGTYVFGGYIQGGGAGEDDLQYATAKVYNSNGTLKNEYTADCKLSGWISWQNPEIKNIVVENGDYVVVGMKVASTKKGAWGTIDDVYMYGIYDVLVDSTIEEGTGTITVNHKKAVSGQTIKVTITPDTGYKLSKLTISGNSIGAETDTEAMILHSANGTVIQEEGLITLTYMTADEKEKKESFKMPKGNVTISTVFTAAGAIDKSVLTDLITTCDSIQKENCSKGSYNALATALAAAKEVVNNSNATQVQINVAKRKLQDAYDALVDISELNRLIAEYMNAEQDKYTEASWVSFKNALDAGQVIVNKENATQDEVNEAVENLQAAIDGLELLQSSPTVPNFTELKKLIDACENLKQSDYTQESWNVLAEALKTAKEVEAKTDAKQEEIDSAKNSLQAALDALSPLTPPNPTDPDFTELNKLISAYGGLNEDDYTQASWEVFEEALEAAKDIAGNTNVAQEEIDNAKNRLQSAFNSLKRIPEGLWAEEIPDMIYTGKALKPTVKVYDGRTLLTSKDYSVSYKNNTKVTTDSELANVVIKGKGNYSGTVTKDFRILPKHLEDKDILVSDLYALVSENNTTAVKINPVVTRNGKKLKLNKEYTVEKEDKQEGAYTKPGKYEVTIKAVDGSGYTGSRKITLTLADKSEYTLMSSVKIKKIPNQLYNEGKAIEPEVIVTLKNKPLTLNKDYKVKYSENNTQAGETVTVTVYAIEGDENCKFIGEKTTTFKITGTPLKAGDITLKDEKTSAPITNAGLVYTGKEIRPNVDSTISAENYTVTYQNNIKAGKATVLITGKNGYTGTVKKTFKITPYDLKGNAEEAFTYAKNITAPYAKGGSKLTDALLQAKFNGMDMVQGVDYTLSYTNNKKVGGAFVKIKGKGNFKGTTETIPFTIQKQSLLELKDISAADLIEKNAKKYKTNNPVVKDLDGKLLKKGTDYEIKTTYWVDPAKEISAEQIPAGEYPQEMPEIPAELLKAGTKIGLTISGLGNYEGETVVAFRIIADNKNLSKAVIKVDDQYYTGKEIEPHGTDEKKDDRAVKVSIKIKENGTTTTYDLREGVDYEILGYTRNINKGTAKITIHGIGTYGGTKTGSFKIKQQQMKWYDNVNQVLFQFKELLN